MAWSRRGDYYDSFLCVCPRQADHPVPRKLTPVPDLELFTFTDDGEMAR
jgi:hypothetical protein